METWTLILMILLVIAIGVLAGGVYYIERENTIKDSNNIMYPFTGQVSGGRLNLVDSYGNPQISCSDKGGGNVNIIGAFFDIEDPYGQCTNKSSPVINATCGIPNKAIGCKNDDDCGTAMKCNEGYCTPNKANTIKNDGTGNIDTDNSECTDSNSDVDYCPVNPGTKCTRTGNECGDYNIMTCVGLDKDGNNGTCQVKSNAICFGVNTTNNTCALFPLCNNADLSGSNVQNKTCNKNINKDTKCMSRDASASLARYCDGKKHCDIINVDVMSNPESPTGPLPCSLRSVSTLPITPGNDGNYNQGYYFHGIYTCIPDATKSKF